MTERKDCHLLCPKCRQDTCYFKKNHWGYHRCPRCNHQWAGQIPR